MTDPICVHETTLLFANKRRNHINLFFVKFLKFLAIWPRNEIITGIKHVHILDIWHCLIHITVPVLLQRNLPDGENLPT